MKLIDIKPHVISESSTPIHMTMLLDEVRNAGKITNTAQTVLIAQLVQLFKFSPVNPQNDILQFQQSHSAMKPRYVYENPTPKELLDDIKGLKDDEQVKLAEWLLRQLAIVEANEDLELYHNPEMALNKWISLVTKAQH
jgi:hypothetical protein